jgi:hypothetical protein
MGRRGEKAVIKGPHRPLGKAFKRFEAELSGMRELTSRGTIGVLPILDWKESADELWYVMPTATPLADRLAETSFDDVVLAIATLANTLDALSRPYQTGQSVLVRQWTGLGRFRDLGMVRWRIHNDSVTRG